MGPGAAVAWTVLWTGASGGHEPSSAARHALAEWAFARGVHVTDAAAARLVAVPVDPAVADGVEADLEKAREAILEQNGALADASLDAAERAVRAHPELPQAAWLLAEVLRTRAARLHSIAPGDAAKAEAAWTRAAALDGGRAPGVGEAKVAEARPDRAASARVSIGGLTVAPGQEVFIDGRATLAVPARAKGEHHVRITDGRRVVWAGWVTVGDDGALHVPMAGAPACSEGDLARARVTAGAVDAAGVACGAWVAAQEVSPGSGELRVASCERDACGPILVWRAEDFAPIANRRDAAYHPFPRWAEVTLACAGVVAASAATIAASGVFRPTHEEPAFVTGGVHVASVVVRSFP